MQAPTVWQWVSIGLYICKHCTRWSISSQIKDMTFTSNRIILLARKNATGYYPWPVLPPSDDAASSAFIFFHCRSSCSIHHQRHLNGGNPGILDGLQPRLQPGPLLLISQMQTPGSWLPTNLHGSWTTSEPHRSHFLGENYALTVFIFSCNFRYCYSLLHGPASHQLFNDQFSCRVFEWQ